MRPPGWGGGIPGVLLKHPPPPGYLNNILSRTFAKAPVQTFGGGGGMCKCRTGQIAHFIYLFPPCCIPKNAHFFQKRAICTHKHLQNVHIFDTPFWVSKMTFLEVLKSLKQTPPSRGVWFWTFQKFVISRLQSWEVANVFVSARIFFIKGIKKDLYTRKKKFTSYKKYLVSHNFLKVDLDFLKIILTPRRVLDFIF